MNRKNTAIEFSVTESDPKEDARCKTKYLLASWRTGLVLGSDGTTYNDEKDAAYSYSLREAQTVADFLCGSEYLVFTLESYKRWQDFLVSD